MASATVLLLGGHNGPEAVTVPGGTCADTDNPIVCENRQTEGVAPQSEWDVAGAGDPDLQGFATDISVPRGGTAQFKITSVADYRVRIYRLGYYGGNGARRLATIPAEVPAPGPQPVLPAGVQTACIVAADGSGLIDCGKWAVSASWSVPQNAVSGIYIARLERADGRGASHIVFIVRDDVVDANGVTVEAGHSSVMDVVLKVAGFSDRVDVDARVSDPATLVGSATKTPTPLRDVPQAVSVVTRELIADQRMASMADVVRFMPGVTMAQGEGNRDTPILRGNASTSDFFVDGVRDDVQYFRDVYNVERVEALKGPNAMIFGRGGAGGVINRVTRQAEWGQSRELSVQLGSWDNRRLTADFGTAFNAAIARSKCDETGVAIITASICGSLIKSLASLHVLSPG